MRVVITGAAGKLGTALVHQLRLRSSWDVFGIDAVEGPNVDARIDVLDRLSMESAFWGADAVVHLAAIPRPTGDPARIMEVNVLGTHNVYAAASATQTRRVVLASSTAVIGTDWGSRAVPPERVPIDEGHPCRPADTYGLSKVCAEEVAQVAWRAQRISSVVLRPPWILDEHDIRHLAETGGIAPAGLHTYAWVHVDDLVRAFERAIEVDIDMAVLFTAATDSTLDQPVADVYRVAGGDEVPGLNDLGPTAAALCSSRAEAVLGWRATRTWRDLNRTEEVTCDGPGGEAANS